MTHMCDVGFELNGADERECILSDPSTGVWSEPLPSCDSKYKFLNRNAFINLYVM